MPPDPTLPATRRSERRGHLALFALFALPILCCALPALIAAGGLAALGSWLHNPWPVAAAGLVLLGVTAWAARRLRNRRAPHPSPGSQAEPQSSHDRGEC